ncbi:MAG TPA: VCBS repeat-containing protein [Verrucomicrobiae bacterium]
MTNFIRLTSILIACPLIANAADYRIHTFKKIQLTDKFWSEGANYGDFNHDGKMDVVSGPYWWEGPTFEKRHEYYPAKTTFKLKKPDGTQEVVEGFEGGLGTNNAYSDNFFAFTYDFNKDGWDDILIIGFPGKEAFWYENPKGKSASDGTEHWPRHMAFDVVDNESPTFGDLTGDGKPEIICHSGGYLGYAEPDWSDPTKPWTFHKISPKGPWQRFTHGYGYGDVNGDGRKDILEANGWWEQPKSLEGDPEWVKHSFKFGNGGAQMHVYDVNGDGLNDVITSIEAHGYGLAWFEQVKDGENITFKEHRIMDRKPEQNKYGLKFSQMHAIDLIDMDGDGLKDIVTGKRFWAHGAGGDAEPNAPAVLYWFKLVRNKDKSVDWVPYLIDDNSGIGTQVVAGDLNRDKLPDIVVGNKKGTFVHIHSAKKVSRAEWEKAQPKPVTN